MAEVCGTCGAEIEWFAPLSFWAVRTEGLTFTFLCHQALEPSDGDPVLAVAVYHHPIGEEPQRRSRPWKVDDGT